MMSATHVMVQRVSTAVTEANRVHQSPARFRYSVLLTIFRNDNRFHSGKIWLSKHCVLIISSINCQKNQRMSRLLTQKALLGQRKIRPAVVDLSWRPDPSPDCSDVCWGKTQNTFLVEAYLLCHTRSSSCLHRNTLAGTHFHCLCTTWFVSPEPCFSASRDGGSPRACRPDRVGHSAPASGASARKSRHPAPAPWNSSFQCSELWATRARSTFAHWRSPGCCHRDRDESCEPALRMLLLRWLWFHSSWDPQICIGSDCGKRFWAVLGFGYPRARHGGHRPGCHLVLSPEPTTPGETTGMKCTRCGKLRYCDMSCAPQQTGRREEHLKQKQSTRFVRLSPWKVHLSCAALTAIGLQ